MDPERQAHMPLGVFTNLIKSNDDTNDDYIHPYYFYCKHRPQFNTNISDNFDFFIQKTQFKQIGNDNQFN